MTKAAYIAKADAICAAASPARDALKAKVEALANETDTASAAHQVADILREAADNLDQELNQLRALPAPTNDQQVLATFYSTADAENAEARHAADAYDDLDTSQVSTLSENAQRDQTKAQGIAVGYGFKVCGQDRSG